MMFRQRLACAVLWLAAIASAGPAAGQTPAPAELRETLLMPFDDAQPDARLYWLAEGSAVLLAD